MKSKVDKLDVYKLVPVLVVLSKLSDVVKNDPVRKDVYNAKIKIAEDKISDITDLATATALNAKSMILKAKYIILLNWILLLLLLLLKIKHLMSVIESKKLSITQALVKLKIKLLLMMIMINIL